MKYIENYSKFRACCVRCNILIIPLDIFKDLPIICFSFTCFKLKKKKRSRNKFGLFYSKCIYEIQVAYIINVSIHKLYQCFNAMNVPVFYFDSWHIFYCDVGFYTYVLAINVLKILMITQCAQRSHFTNPCCFTYVQYTQFSYVFEMVV